MRRTPTAKELNDFLDNKKWEDLCNHICVEEFSTKRVNDANGKGNGLDAYKILDDNSLIGYQFKRYTSSFKDSQIETLKKNIKDAKQKTQTELGITLNKFIVIFNMNLEPSHFSVEGDLKKFESRVVKWAKENYDVQVEYLDLNWVHTKLLKYPHFCPELFEEYMTTNVFKTGIEPLEEKMNKLIEMSKPYKHINKLIKSSNMHYSRAREGNYLKRIDSVILNLEDAVELLDVEGECIDVEFRGKILMCLSGMYVLVFNNTDAIKCAEEAMSILKDEDDKAYCKGNLAFALLESSGDINFAEKLFTEILEHFKSKYNLSETIRTSGHLLQIYIYKDRIKKVISFSENLNKIINQSMESGGELTDVILSAQGAIANSYVYLGDYGFEEYYQQSLEILDRMMRTYKRNGIYYMFYKVKISKATILCRIDKEKDGKIEFDEVIFAINEHLNRAQDDSVYHLLAISLFNKAFMIEGLNKDEKQITLLEAEKLYLRFGDTDTVQEIREELRKII
ncbi:hypothetical protein ASD24_28610 [Paenibacillus sp. Root52]|uniref:hypothetical protein n=1 Tax=Paenibacillus sp. Root52 TaxID=1736552 RepID=UPI0007009FD4|nr:hypothetical protein [Paenibacillus sp. Root52]KQY85246.1 hypothetical protein ASD24_28610 [Paenibacillus sp. Root52]